MFSWLLFNIIIICGFHGNLTILSATLLANIIALIEYRARRDREESERQATIRSTRKLFKG